MNPQALINVFGKIPEFFGSELLDIQLRRDGPALFIRLMTTEKVLSKPKRWDKWDVVYIEVSFFAVRDLRINGYGTNNLIEQFNMIDNGDDAELLIICANSTQIKCSFEWARVEQISPGLIGTP